MWPKHTKPAQRNSADCIPDPSCVTNYIRPRRRTNCGYRRDDGAAEILEDAARNRSPTARLEKRLEPLSRGDMNGDKGDVRNLEDTERNRSLTWRQRAVLELLTRGDTNKVIARRLGMREGTVKAHIRQIMRKFGVTNRTQVVVACASADEHLRRRRLVGQ
jgi:DNA-binding CsgD family transcriptional regulator